MIGVFDYGAGNLRSVGNTLDHLELPWKLVTRSEELDGCDRAILPGVGHFGSAMEELNARRLTDGIRVWVDTGRPLLGICLGAQVLLDSGAEAPGVPGLGLIPGTVEALATKTIPHMGWNRVNVQVENPILSNGEIPAYFYFAHSYVCVPAEPADVAATCTCDNQTFCVSVRRGNVFGVQFHPEKSAAAGLDVLRRFATC